MLVAIMAALTITIGACGGGGTAAPPGTGAPATTGDGTPAGGKSLGVCSMLDAPTVEGVLGGRADAGVDNSTGDLAVCSWRGLDDPTEVLTISIYAHPDPATAREQYLATTEGAEGVDILGLGDEASYSETFGLRVLVGRYDLAVDSTAADEKTADLGVAKIVLASLP